MNTLTNFSDIKVLVIGDLMLDRWMQGSVNRISPEAPVPVIQVHDQHESLGGAANVAANVSGLGATCTLIGFLGKDPAGDAINRLAKNHGIHIHAIHSEAPTTTKIRALGNHQQVVRLDIEDSSLHSEKENEKLLKKIQSELAKTQIVILSDYAKGLCSDNICKQIISLAQNAHIPICVDPKNADWTRYSGASYITPNLKEFRQVSHHDLRNSDEPIQKQSQEILKDFNLTGILVTRSEQGMTLAENQKVTHIRTEAKEVFDVSGAGDTVIATFACSLAKGLTSEKAARLANKAAGIVVAKVGTIPIDKVDLENVLNTNPQESKIVDRKKLQSILDEKKRAGKRIVFTNGCFDILHRGHLSYLSKAKDLGDFLVIGLNSDSSVKKLKGSNRPIHNEEDRAYMLACLEFVDAVCLFTEDTPEKLLSALCPHILVKGADYKKEDVLGKEFVEEVVLIDFVQGYSSTKFIDQMKEIS